MTATRRAMSASAFMVAARGVGVALRLGIAAWFSIDVLGFYATVLAGAGLLTMFLDAYYVVETPRASDSSFRTDRSTRWRLGVLLMVAGGLLTPMNAVAAITLAKAGVDIGFNAVQSRPLREGRPNSVYAWEFARQVNGCIAVGVAVALFDVGPAVVTAAYVVGLAPFTLGRLELVKPRLPQWSRRTRFLLGEAAASAVYVQGDILLLAYCAGSRAAGWYSFGSIAVWLIALVGQNHVSAHHEALRAAAGASTAGPRPTDTWLWAGAAALGLGAIAAGLAALGFPSDAWLMFAVLAPVGATRIWSATCATILVTQHRDALRLRLAIAGALLKSAGVVALASVGSVGAAAAFLLADLVVTGLAARAVYGRRA